MDFLSLIPVIVSSASTIKQIIDIANSNDELVKKIQSSVPSLASLLESLGGSLFPNAKPQLRIAAGAMAAFDPDVTKWLQGSLNVLVDPSPNLVVDGIYGKQTKAAVEKLQAKLGLTVDGWAGQLTQAAIASALANRPVIR